jgi:hypothetical protein
MTVVTHVYSAYLNDMLIGGGAWTTATVNCALFSASTFTAADATYTASGTECAATGGYSTGGGAVGTRTLSAATVATQLCKITGAFGGGAAGTTTWTSSGAGITAVAAKLYVVSGHPIAHIDFGGSQTASGGGTFIITWDATNGVFNLASS